jgi:hypothetical protein
MLDRVLLHPARVVPQPGHRARHDYGSIMGIDTSIDTNGDTSGDGSCVRHRATVRIGSEGQR